MSLRNRIIVKDVEKDVAKHGSIWIPDNTKKSYKEMEIVRGAASKKLPKGLNIGDKVYVRPTAGSPINIEGEELAIIDRGDVLLIP